MGKYNIAYVLIFDIYNNNLNILIINSDFWEICVWFTIINFL